MRSITPSVLACGGCTAVRIWVARCCQSRRRSSGELTAHQRGARGTRSLGPLRFNQIVGRWLIGRRSTATASAVRALPGRRAMLAAEPAPGRFQLIARVVFAAVSIPFDESDYDSRRAPWRTGRRLDRVRARLSGSGRSSGLCGRRLARRMWRRRRNRRHQRHIYASRPAITTVYRRAGRRGRRAGPRRQPDPHRLHRHLV
jgi:hypothetical protein